MLRISPYIIALSGILLLLVVGVGCRKQPATPPPMSDVTTAKEVKPGWVDPFLDAAKGNVSAISADNLGKFYVSGLVILLVAVGVKLFTGSWRDAFIVSALGMLPSVGAVLLTDYPRVVLLVPLCGLAVLIAYGVRRAVEWRIGYRAWVASATVTEAKDTGPHSLGQRTKNMFKDAGIANILDKALKPLEKLWEKQPPNPSV